MSAISQEKINYVKAALLQCLSPEAQKQGEQLITAARDSDMVSTDKAFSSNNFLLTQSAFLQTIMMIFNEAPVQSPEQEAQN